MNNNDQYTTIRLADGRRIKMKVASERLPIFEVSTRNIIAGLMLGMTVVAMVIMVIAAN